MDVELECSRSIEDMRSFLPSLVAPSEVSRDVYDISRLKVLSTRHVLIVGSYNRQPRTGRISFSVTIRIIGLYSRNSDAGSAGRVSSFRSVEGGGG